jgi:hypothetical protein
MFPVNFKHAKTALLPAMLFVGGVLMGFQAQGDVIVDRHDPLRLAELVTGGGATQAGRAGSEVSGGAGRQADRARMYEQQGDDDDGPSLTAPGRMSQPPGWSPSVVDRARAYRDSGEGVATEVITGDVLQRDDSYTARSASENRRKARVYTSTATGNDIDLSYVGRDGIPLVKCEPVDNIAGRIGDDGLPGSLVMIFVRGKQVKVRCR